MDYETAIEARITPTQALAEISKHGHDCAYYEGEKTFPYVEARCEVVNAGRVDIETHHFYTDDDGMISGKEILDWLGY